MVNDSGREDRAKEGIAMIDIESKIFTIVYNAVHAYDNTIYVTSETAIAPPSFPAVYVEQIDSYDPPEFRISTHEELYAAVVFNVEVYSNKADGKKAEAKSIFTVIDNALRAAGLRRTTSNYVDLTDNRNSSVSNRNQAIIRLLGRYECLADGGGNIYARR